MNENEDSNLSRMVEGIIEINQVLNDKKPVDSIHSMYEKVEITANALVPLYEVSAQIGTAIHSAISSEAMLSIGNTIRNFSCALSDALESPFVKWLSSIDIASFLTAWEILPEQSKRISEDHLTAMYKTKWFPYVAYLVDGELLIEINEISKGNQNLDEKAEGRIDLSTQRAGAKTLHLPSIY